MKRHLRLARTAIIVACLASLLVGCPQRSAQENQAEIHLYAAQIHLQDKQPKLALTQLELAKELVPDYPKTHLLLGVAYANGGRLEEAFEEYRFVTEREPENEKAWLFWGQALYLSGRFGEAVNKLERAAGLEPNSGLILSELGIALSASGRHDAAVSTLGRMAEVEPDPPTPALLAWGTSLASLGQGAEARKPLEAILAKDPDHLSTLSILGAVLENSDDPSERERAVALHERALRAVPGDAAALHNLGRAYLATGRAGEAYDLIQRSLAMTDPSDFFYAARQANLERARAGLPRTRAGDTVPNVLLIVLDTLRADHLGSYGYPRATSPHIDGLARQGVLFESAISQAPWTAASIASLFTSLYPSVHGLNGGIRWGAKQGSGGNDLPFATQKTLAAGQLTLAEMLRRNGYRTAGFVSNVYVNSIFGFSQGFETYGDDHGDYSRNVARAKRRANETNRQVFAWLEKEIEEPFFLFVHYNDCHWPYDPPAPFGREWVKDYQGDLTPERTTAIVERQGEPITGLSDEDLRYLIGLYDGEIAYADAAVSDLMEKVQSAELERELLTVVTADHGEEFLDHGSASHGYTLFDEQIRVPLIFHLPGRLEPRRVASQVRLIDVMPSILDLAGVAERPGSIQGESLVALLTGETERGPSAAYSEATYVGEQKSLRADGKLKLIYRAEDEGTSLFDLASDPDERSDVAGEQPAVVTSLRDQLQRWNETNQELRTKLFDKETEQEVILDDETQERLRALGYIQ